MAHLSLIPRMWLRKHGISTNTRSELTIYQQEVFDNDSVSLGTSPNIPSPWKPFTGFGCTLFSDKLKIVTACYSVCWDVKFIEMPQGLHISPHIYIYPHLPQIQLIEGTHGLHQQSLGMGRARWYMAPPMAVSMHLPRIPMDPTEIRCTLR